ncbi:MAG: DUF1330 domain-containing protein [Betaproteobacteria bacterium]|nr:DUF1330 domain-containing protein [Betaproteobacteria bacterium]
MAAYVIVDVTVTDPATFEEYRRLAGLSVAAHGGKFLVRGGKWEPLEGDWQPTRIVVIEFPTVDRAKLWYASPGYKAARDVRARAANMRMVVVEGVA